MAPRRAVVFGGAGFVGLNLAGVLAERGWEVTVFDRAEPPPAAPGIARSIVGDVRDAAAIAAAIEPGTDTVIWGAAITADAARESSEPEAVIDVNLAALVPVLRCARERGVRRVVNLSSVSAYGEAAFGITSLCEDEPLPDPRTLYAITKYATERLCARMGDLWKLDVVSVRLSTVFGPWEGASVTRDTPSPFMQLMRLASRGGEARLAWAGACDWLYAQDAAHAVLALAEAPRLAHRLYNIGPGATFTVAEWGARLAALRPGFTCRIAGAGEAPNVDLRRSRERAPLDIARLAGECGFVPQFGLEASLAHLDAWSRSHQEWFA